MGLDGKQWVNLIRTHKARSDHDRKEWDLHGKWYLSEDGGSATGEADLPTGTAGTDGIADGRDEVTFSTNYAYAFVDTMVANVCPTVPSVTVNPRRDDLRESARYREALINDTLKRNSSHDKLWLLAAKTSVFRRAFLKVIWNDRRQMPVFRVLDPRVVWFDMAVEDWDDVRYIIEVTALTRQQFEKRVKGKGRKGFYTSDVAEKATFAPFPQWMRDQTREKQAEDSTRDIFEWVVVYECYDFTEDGGKFHQFLEGIEEPLFTADLPFRFCRNPYHMLVFNDNLQDIGGLSDIKLIESVQMRLNELDTLELWHAQSSIPVLLVNTGLVDDSEELKSALRNATSPGQFIDVKGKNKASVRDIISQTPTPSLTPSFATMRDRCTQVIEFVLGIPQYSRGQVGNTDVATEVALADAATRTRNGRRQKRINDCVGWMAEVIVALYEEFLPEDSTLPVRITGAKDLVEISRKNMAMRELKDATGEEQLTFDYEAVASSAVENSRLVQLKNLRENWDVLQMGVQQQQVDPRALLDHLLGLLQMPQVLSKEPPPATPQAGQPPMPGGAPPAPEGPLPVPGTDTLQGGALPTGTEVPIPIDLQGGAGANQLIGDATRAAKNLGALPNKPQLVL